MFIMCFNSWSKLIFSIEKTYIVSYLQVSLEHFPQNISQKIIRIVTFALWLSIEVQDSTSFGDRIG